MDDGRDGGALGVTREKPTVYRLGTGPMPSRVDIERSVKVLLAAAAVSLVLLTSAFLIVRRLLGLSG